MIHEPTASASAPESTASTGGEYLTPQQLAARIQLSPKTLMNWRSLGKGPAFVTFGRRVRYPLAAVVEWEQAAGDQSPTA